MKKTIITFCLLVCIGCQNVQEERAALIQRFQQAYPETWQKELLEYDIQQEEIKRQALRNLSKDLRQMGNGQTLEVYPSMPNNNYWQEKRAKQEYQEREYEKRCPSRLK